VVYVCVDMLGVGLGIHSDGCKLSIRFLIRLNDYRFNANPIFKKKEEVYKWFIN